MDCRLALSRTAPPEFCSAQTQCSGRKWYIVLLKGNGEKGYFIDGTKLKGGLSMGGDDYKIHPNELSDWTSFNFYSDLFGVILQRN